MAYTYVQQNTASTNSLSLGAASTKGDLIVFAVVPYMPHGAAAPTYSAVDNGSGNMWVQAGPPVFFNYVNTYDIYLFSFFCLSINPPAGVLTLTANRTSGSVPAAYWTALAEYGVPVGTALDQLSYGVATSGVATSVGMPVSTNLSTSGELLVFPQFNLNGTLGSPIAGWNLRINGYTSILDNLSGPAAGAQTINPISLTAANQWDAALFAFYVPPPPPMATKFNPSTYMRLLAQQNKVLGGPGAKTTDNEFTLIARNNVLLGGTMASPADTIFSLLSRQNKLLGGPGARAGDSEFSLYCRNLKLLGGSPNTNDNVITLLTKINALI
jgi:hypothetical protein